MRNSKGCWIGGFSCKNNATNHTITELQALEYGLQLAYDLNLFPVEVETDSTEVLENIDNPNPIYNSIPVFCRSLLRKLGNPPLRHCFHQENKVTEFLAKQESKLTTSNMANVLFSPPAKIAKQVQNDQNGVVSTRFITKPCCNKLTSFGNLSLIRNQNNGANAT
ncbi:hypothetical protein HAX54_008119 [Datura stramonium]|uniref:RNase H type-1 domain-containing protein n=1 Tax=Datura stramonium TaxID=4076 RepID=A0ABS8TEE1_DATST|nr:hypothetical protein [Datura stramonium]